VEAAPRLLYARLKCQLTVNVTATCRHLSMTSPFGEEVPPVAGCDAHNRPVPRLAPVSQHAPFDVTPLPRWGPHGRWQCTSQGAGLPAGPQAPGSVDKRLACRTITLPALVHATSRTKRRVVGAEALRG
jgi:hypothetical protein